MKYGCSRFAGDEVDESRRDRRHKGAGAVASVGPVVVGAGPAIRPSMQYKELCLCLEFVGYRRSEIYRIVVTRFTTIVISSKYATQYVGCTPESMKSKQRAHEAGAFFNPKFIRSSSQ
jgi:hypothetical protein